MYRDCFYDGQSLLTDIHQTEGESRYELAKNSIGLSSVDLSLKRYIRWPRNQDDLPISLSQFKLLLDTILGGSISISDVTWVRYGRVVAYMNETRTSAFPILEGSSIYWDAANNLKYNYGKNTAILMMGTPDRKTVRELQRFISDQLARGETTIYVTPEVMPI